MTKQNQKWLIIGLVLVCVALLLAAIFRALTPQTEPIPATPLINTNRDGSSSDFENITFSGDEPSLPSRFKIVQVARTEGAAEAIRDRMIATLGLTPSTSSDTIWTGVDYTLSTSDPSQWRLSRSQPQIGQPPIVVDQAVTTASQFTAQYIQNQDLAPYTTDVQYLDADAIHFDETTPEAANLAAIPFTILIDNYPVVYANQDEYPLVAYISSLYEVEKITFTPEQYQLAETASTLPPISIEQAIENLNNNHGAIIHSTQTEFGLTNLSQITGGTLTQVRLEYRIDPILNLAYPFYRFSGAATNAQGVEMNVEVITPAVETTLQ